MERTIVIQSGFGETSLAVLEDDKLVELHTERLYQEKLAGNIYLGRVTNVLPGMQAAFVDIGLGKNALLHNEDVFLESGDTPPGFKGKRPSIADVIKEGQELLVQVAKEGTGNKGPRVTTRISLPGRYVVLMPDHDHLFLSRRISEEEERARVKAMALKFKKPGSGMIIRTVAQEACPEDLEADFGSLEALWVSIQDKRRDARAPALLHQDLELVPGLLRDLLSTEVSRLIVNTQEVKEQVMGIVEILAPHLKKRVVLKEGDLLDLFKIPSQMEQALHRRIWLNCGGYLVIDATEALTAIDVNTGRFIGSTSLADTALKVNLEAATEVGRQLRLRNIGGMVVVDFIDMPSGDYWDLVLAELESQVKRDRVKTQVLGLTRLGLVEISRKKTRKSLAGLWLRNCPYCKGSGRVLGIQSMVSQARQKLYSMAMRTAAPGIFVTMNSQVAAIFIETILKDLELQTGKEIAVLGRKSCHRETVEMEALYSSGNIGKKLIPLEEGQILRWVLDNSTLLFEAKAIIELEGYRIEIPLTEELSWEDGKAFYVEITKVWASDVQGRLLAVDG